MNIDDMSWGGRFAKRRSFRFWKNCNTFKAKVAHEKERYRRSGRDLVLFFVCPSDCKLCREESKYVSRRSKRILSSYKYRRYLREIKRGEW